MRGETGKCLLVSGKLSEKLSGSLPEVFRKFLKPGATPLSPPLFRAANTCSLGDGLFASRCRCGLLPSRVPFLGHWRSSKTKKKRERERERTRARERFLCLQGEPANPPSPVPKSVSALASWVADHFPQNYRCQGSGRARYVNFIRN